MLEALLAIMPTQLGDEVKSVRNLLIVSGCAPREARANTVELYSPPRVTSELSAAQSLYPGLRANSTFYLVADEHGQTYDFRRAADRQRCRERLRTERPWLVIGSPPCTWWSSLMALNRAKLSDQEIERRDPAFCRRCIPPSAARGQAPLT